MDAARERLSGQIAFLKEIAQLVTISRRTLIIDGSRFENDAEHSWHMAVAALLLQEYAPFPTLDVSRAVQMALLHDIVEVHAGDTYAYDAAGNAGREERERQAADLIFSRLPGDQARLFRGLWEEFELRQTPEAKYAAALDRVQPLILNHSTGGRIWRENRITAAQVQARIAPVREGAPVLWEYLNELVSEAVSKGWLIG